MPSSRTGLTPHLRFRRGVLTRDRAAGITHCPECGCQLDYDVTRQPNSAESDHIVPAAVAKDLGWTDAQINKPSNGRTICRRCNQSRGKNNAPKRRPDKKHVEASPGW